MKRFLYFIGAVGVAAVVFGAVYMMRQEVNNPANLPSLIDTQTFGSLVKKDASGIDVSHVGNGVTPPTNKWFSGIALQAKPQTVFPTPLSFTPTDDSFTFDVPGVSATPKTIMATARQPIKVTIGTASYYRVTRYDELSVDLTFYSADTALGTVTLVAGVPYIYFHGLSDVTLGFDGAATLSKEKLTFQSGDTTSVAAAFDNATVGTDGAHAISVKKNGLVSFYAGKTSLIKTLDRYAMNRIENTHVTYEKNGSNYKTTISYKTSNDKPTYFGTLPHQQITAHADQTIATIYGDLKLQSGTRLDFTTPVIPVIESLDLSKLSSDERSMLSETVRRDINAPHEFPDDSYYSGKAVYREAQLFQLAKQLNDSDAASTAQTRLRKVLGDWLQPGTSKAQSFYYDTKIHGIVGVTPSFGSEAFNDHHFHYGYFIYAASILANYDTEFSVKYRSAINMLVADIANYRTNDQLPLRRSFDPYFGHSWASGSSPFADGNNQESVSEAINAWVGISLWADRTANETLGDEAKWMLSNEVAAASAYWLDFDRTKAPYVNGYDHGVVTLNWSGKRDYATFFSADPRAQLGILLIPMNPTSQYLAQYDERITEQLKEARANSSSEQFEDYLLMYESLHAAKDELNRAKQLPDTSIDSANSRSYLYAWIMSQD